MLRLVASRSSKFIATLPTAILKALRWPLPDRSLNRTLAALGLAAMPLLPLQLVQMHTVRWSVASIAIGCALLAVMDRVIASLQIRRVGRMAIRAKQVGVRQDLTEFKELEIGGWSALPLLLVIVLVVPHR